MIKYANQFTPKQRTVRRPAQSKETPTVLTTFVVSKDGKAIKVESGRTVAPRPGTVVAMDFAKKTVQITVLYVLEDLSGEHAEAICETNNSIEEVKAAAPRGWTDCEVPHW